MKQNVAMISFVVWYVKFGKKIVFYVVIRREKKHLVCVVS